QGYRVTSVENGSRGLEMIQEESFDVIILDLKMPDIYGLDVLQRIKEDNPHTMVIIITGYGTIEIAVKAMQGGAFNFITKPFTPEALIAMTEKAVLKRRQLLESTLSAPSISPEIKSNKIIGRSPKMVNVVRLTKKFAATDSTVLIIGETGVGKELLAETMHRWSKRCLKPFVTLDCGSFVESLFESEMFGHVKGSFTGAIETTKGKFELARGGTIFLDEITNIGINMQARLLRAIQEKEISKVGSAERIKVNVRIIAASNRDLPGEIEKGRFREDLYYRLNVVPIRIPPLRERREDIETMARHFIDRFSSLKGDPPPELSEEALSFMTTYDWPGNVRELKNMIERAIVICDGKYIKMDDLLYEVPINQSFSQSNEGSLSKAEEREIRKALKKFDGQRSKTAEYLGINRKTLREKIQKYGIVP
ncbi:MAG: sigma-54 dependent transcriptional regulator, partial [Thermodesulfobacteriota bacterium]|nr:sigma-54 dependent transcriptional regulator [Thermodesulfobacteriota bacterium]